NRLPLYRAASGSIDEARPPLDDDTIHYYGQYVALVVADTLEQAQAAARAVRVGYEALTPDVSPPGPDDIPAPDGDESARSGDDEPARSLTLESERGDEPSAYAQAPVRVDAIYTTPVETHNSMELHACVAAFD